MYRIATAALIAVVAVSGCSSDTDTGAEAPESSAEAPSSAEPTESASDVPDDLTGLALTAEDFPAPYTYTELPPEAREEAANAADGGITANPPECGRSPLTDQANLITAGVALAAAEDGSSVLETVTQVIEPLSALSDLVSTCSEYSIELPGQGGATARASVSETDAPTVPDADTAATRATTTSNATGSAITVNTITYFAQIDGVQVSLVATAAPGTELDPALLEDLLLTGVEKVQSGR